MSVYVYKFGFGDGGLADFIQYALYAIHKYNGQNFLIKIDHPNYKYIKFKKESLDYHKNKEKIIGLNEIEIRSTQFFSSKEALEEFNKYRDGNIPFFDFFDFSKEVYAKYEELRPKNDYITIHIRFGDKYLENQNRGVMSCMDDTRVGNNSYDYYFSLIDKIIEENKDVDIMLLADNKKFKDMCKLEFPSVVINDINIIHTGNTYTDNTNFDEQLIMTIAEFLLICKSKEIHSLTYSGFSVVANLISTNTIKKYY